ncbi:hypothetical protein WOLCODRAFT_167847 [Wolfiporia cocos MD-104 SS10]|uniref:Extracellular metalloproteinase n=1 Tax=Wolfiporia cocos (strain MD-104) TaxID=742152 RepID=A0A2H3JK72_WOLCO|nr:hypothetical protein WOLCODRAFT_167847 [Wolfiporia cocos MD-104 SS10]
MIRVCSLSRDRMEGPAKRDHGDGWSMSAGAGSETRFTFSAMMCQRREREGTASGSAEEGWREALQRAWHSAGAGRGKVSCPSHRDRVRPIAIVVLHKPGGVSIYLISEQSLFRRRYLTRPGTTREVRALGKAFHHYFPGGTDSHQGPRCARAAPPTLGRDAASRPAGRAAPTGLPLRPPTARVTTSSTMENPEAHLDKVKFSSETHFRRSRPRLPSFVQVPNGDSTAFELVWKFEVEMQDVWYEAAVSAALPHHIISVVDWASDSPMPVAPILPFSNITWHKENFDALTSPVGWHLLPYANHPQSLRAKVKSGLHGEVFRNTTTTWGNNVFARENWDGRNDWEYNHRPDAGADMVFDFTCEPKETDRIDALSEVKKYIDATVTQLFYTSNLVHDLCYRYGFDEVSGNFQQHNFGRGGEENDAVITNAQEGSGYSNSERRMVHEGVWDHDGRCRMYLWNTANPYRDGDLKAGIVIHELSYGLSTRLTGGPANSGCLGWGESSGMGEGWGGFLATTIRSNKNYSDYAMGAWAASRPNERGVTYKTLDKPGYWDVHAIGKVWAELLWVVSQCLIAKHGFVDMLSPPAPLPDGTMPEGDLNCPTEYTVMGIHKPLMPKHGNPLIVQLVLICMKLQPYRPSFFDERDAIISTDQVLTGGENYFDLWTAFAERGLGSDARVDGRTPGGGGVRTNDFSVPAKCKADAPTGWYCIVSFVTTFMSSPVTCFPV